MFAIAWHQWGIWANTCCHPVKIKTLCFVSETSPTDCRAALKLVPHSSFTFAKLWLLAAKLEVSVLLTGRCVSCLVNIVKQSASCAMVRMP